MCEIDSCLNCTHQHRDERPIRQHLEPAAADAVRPLCVGVRVCACVHVYAYLADLSLVAWFCILFCAILLYRQS